MKGPLAKTGPGCTGQFIVRGTGGNAQDSIDHIFFGPLTGTLDGTDLVVGGLSG